MLDFAIAGPHKSTSPHLIDILADNKPLYHAAYPLDNRILTVTVYSNQVDLHLAGPNGGQGDTIFLTPTIALDIVNVLLAGGREAHKNYFIRI